MNIIEQLNEARQLAGLNPLNEAQTLDLVEKKLTGQAKADFLAKMGGKAAKSDKKDEKPADDKKPAFMKKDEKKADAKDEKKPSKKKVSEEINDILAHFGAEPLSAVQVKKLDEATAQ